PVFKGVHLFVDVGLSSDPSLEQLGSLDDRGADFLEPVAPEGLAGSQFCRVPSLDLPVNLVGVSRRENVLCPSNPLYHLFDVVASCRLAVILDSTRFVSRHTSLLIGLLMCRELVRLVHGVTIQCV